MGSRFVMLAVLVVPGALGGCYVDRTPPPRYAGDPSADPSIAALPSAEAAAPEYTDTMRFGLTLAEESLSLEAPTPPPSRSTRSLVDWSATDLRRWLERKSHTVDAARRELDVAAEEDHRQRIVAGAVVGLIYEDVAQTLRRLPVPTEVADDREAARLYQEVLDGRASPFVAHAHAAYRACAENAHHPRDMRHWSRFCAARAERLAPVAAPESLGPDQTVVEVVTD